MVMKNHHEEFNKLAEMIKEKCRNKKIYYFANPGNWGDALIRHGTIKFFDDHGIDYTELTSKRIDWILPVIRGGVVIYGGGGGWCDVWGHSERIVNKLRRRFPIIVLPSSYDKTFMIPNTLFFSRDLFESKNNMDQSIFCHDMAFYIGMLPSTDGSGTGCFFRSDKETSGRITIPDTNIDLSVKGTHFSDVKEFIEVIARYKIIYTDRLHIAIAACLLGREVHLYPGSYFKSRAIFNSSLKDYFNNVYFHEEAAF